MPVIKANGYSITISNTTFLPISEFLAKRKYSQFFILCDENTLKLCLPLVVANCPALADANIIEIESGESSKVIDVCSQIWQTLLDNQADKHSLLINLGGGVVSDLGGFAASVYKRGIDFITIPTSLLAMADASIGGKTGIDFGGIKNSIGSFAQPKAVFVIPKLIDTLPNREYQNGLAEIFKIALVSDRSFWNDLISKATKPEQIIAKSISLKNKIVLQDPFDKGIRKTLNFGHTIGHAIEALSLHRNEDVLHGEAIIIGMIIEIHLSFQKKLISTVILKEITAVLVSAFVLKRISHLPLDKLLYLIDNDKKRQRNKLLFALITKIGACRVNVPATTSEIKKAISYYNRLTS